jgi:hypothetical protein
MSQCRIIIVCFNRPDLIEPQYRTIEKFFKKPYEIHIFNNSNNAAIFNDIKSVSERLGLPHFPVPPGVITNRHDASVSCGESCQYALKTSGYNYNGPVLLLDSDVFFVKPFDPEEYLVDNEIVGVGQQKGHIFYYTNQMMLFDPTKMPNPHEMDMRCGYVEGILCDVGGHLHHYFSRYPAVRKGSSGQICPNQYRNEDTIRAISDNEVVRNYLRAEVSLNGGFSEIFGRNKEAIHMRAGSNWVGFDANMFNKRNENLFKMIQQL